MATGKITLTAVKAMGPGSWLWDSEVRGFGARRQTDGVFYYLRYRLGGRQGMKTIGPHGSPWTPDTARAKAKVGLGEVAQGRRPFEMAEGLAEANEAFGTVVKRYLAAKRETMKPRAYAEIERHLLRSAKSLHRERIGKIIRYTIANLLNDLEKASGPVARNRIRASLSAFFEWAITQGLIEVNPAKGTAVLPEARAERVLTDAELAEIWAALPADHFGDIVRLLILTGQRREEIGALRWSEVNTRDGIVTLPPERVKNNRQHQFALAPQAAVIIERQTRRNDRDLIFGIGKGGFSGWSGCKERLDDAILANRRKANPKAKSMPDWRLHDLRRTAATGMAELGVLPHIVEAVLNHVSGHKAGVAGIYNRARYEDDARAALVTWAEHVTSIV